MRPRWGDVRQFCLRQGYRERRTNHYRYVKVLANRTTSGTMVSLGVDGQEVPAQMWHRVWSSQLRLVNEAEFWQGLRGEQVRYAEELVKDETEKLPSYLLRFLRDVLHLPDADVEVITREQAQRLLNEHESRELREP